MKKNNKINIFKRIKQSVALLGQTILYFASSFSISLRVTTFIGIVLFMLIFSIFWKYVIVLAIEKRAILHIIVLIALIVVSVVSVLTKIITEDDGWLIVIFWVLCWAVIVKWHWLVLLYTYLIVKMWLWRKLP